MHRRKRYIMLLIAAGMTASACSKSNPGPDKGMLDGISTVIHDLAGDVDASVGSSGPGKEKRDFHTFLFRLSDQRQIWLKNAADSAEYLPRTDWDLAFSNFYNSTVYVNDGSRHDLPWSGNDSRHKILLVNRPYDLVDSAPSDAEFDHSTLSGVGMITDRNSPGWYNYNITTHLVQVVPDRTYVLRLSDGKYAKLQFINVYKGNPPAVTDLNWPAPYFTFRYFVQKDGSKNLKTK